ncbi:hypothetical protein BDP55DRAFT_633830 [Colletotrichum godetiae]|uniref:Uncharacterized protein n=1 Tax=Colletotrichum godetiae TaxID=1209918 RepID=A0AAJ0AGM7_9PEZI|nr:uncharacterized protein BDP55DRAFT_633830 [Colletotrichum godetiae]KAK1673548.1 hypothetical protein BDP55DRAFT_633830 [Colletotrichum godetiae]
MLISLRFCLSAFLALCVTTANSLPFQFSLAPITKHLPTISPRQVGNGVNGNQTGNSGSISSGGIGDGNGVGFAGTGNDIDTGKDLSDNRFPSGRLLLTFSVSTGDDFDIGDGNNTIGDGNTIEIGDRITEVTNINVGSGNLSDIGIGSGKGARNSTGNATEMSININLRVMVEDGRVSVGVV